MKITAHQKDARRYLIHDIDNDCILKAVVSADDEKGEYRQYVTYVEDGETKFKFNEDKTPVTEVKTGNIKIIDTRLPENRELCERLAPWYKKDMDETK